MALFMSCFKAARSAPHAPRRHAGTSDTVLVTDRLEGLIIHNNLQPYPKKRGRGAEAQPPLYRLTVKVKQELHKLLK